MKPSFPKGAKPLVYSIHGRMVLQVQHEDERDEALPELILDWLSKNRLLRDADDLYSAVVELQNAPPAEQQRRIVTLPGPEKRPRSLITLDLGMRGQGELIERVLKLNDEIRRSDRPDQQPGSVSQSSMPQNDEPRGQDGRDEPLSLVIATPEWLLSGAPIHLGGGGPGGRPRPVRDNTTLNGASVRKKWQIELPASLGGVASGHGGEGVTVFMLDTAPCAHAMARAYAAWGGKHELVRALLGPASPLHITYADYADLLELELYGVQKHNYVMSDHGLFVAGIVHSLVPQARLELIEVLNPYGVGSTSTIAKGLAQVARRVAAGEAAPLVVNMSLVITLPQPGDLKRLQEEDPHSWKAYDKRSFTALCKRLEAEVRQQLEWICHGLNQQDVLLVAAAGNDAKGGVRPPARLPAAFDEVVGVGAVNPDNLPAPYSNLSDELTASTTNMIASFGGDLDLTTVEEPQASEHRGMIGIYIGDFPRRRGGTAPANRNGWAAWAGTSFAAPIIAGVLARLRSPAASNLSPAAAAAKVMAAAVAPTGTPNEKAVPATQV